MKLIQTNDRLIQQFQTNVREVVDPLINNPITNGVFINKITLLAGITNVIPTTLNKNLTGWMVSRLNANSIIWDSQDLNTTPNQNLQLHCSADCIISLYVF